MTEITPKNRDDSFNGRPTACQHLLITDHTIITTTLFLHSLDQLQALVGAGHNTIDASSSTALSLREICQ